jgi:hypothetical protein
MKTVNNDTIHYLKYQISFIYVYVQVWIYVKATKSKYEERGGALQNIPPTIPLSSQPLYQTPQETQIKKKRKGLMRMKVKETIQDYFVLVNHPHASRLGL